MKRHIPLFGLIVAYFLPPTLFLMGLVPFSLRFVIFIGLTVAVTVYGIKRYSWRGLGFRTDNLTSALIANSVLIGIGLPLILLSLRIGFAQPTHISKGVVFYLFYVLILSGAQELAYRAIPRAELDRAKITNPLARLLLLVVPYAFVHVVYHNTVMITVAAVVGFAWALAYERWPNLLGVTISHAILGAVAIYLGLI